MSESRFFCPFCGNRLTIAANNAEEYEVWCGTTDCEGASNVRPFPRVMEEIWSASESVGIGLCEEWAEARHELTVRLP